MSENNFAHGTCNGTGAVLNVCLGFKPVYIKLFNIEDAGSALPVAEWHREMQFVTAIAEGYKEIGISDTDFDRTILAATYGISEYDGGDEITYDKNTSVRWETAAGADASELYVDGHFKRTATGSAEYKCIGDSICPNPQHGAKVKTPPGFTLAADAALNADGERICWIAFG